MMTAVPSPLLAPPIRPDAPAYFCPVCNSAYPTMHAAMLCAASMPLEKQTSLRPGDVVIINEGYEWADNETWIGKRGAKTPVHGKPTHSFYFIVTALTAEAEVHRCDPFDDNRHQHRALLHLATGAANIARSGPHAGFRLGWTPLSGHVQYRLARPDAVPETVRAAIPRVLGWETRDLL